MPKKVLAALGLSLALCACNAQGTKSPVATQSLTEKNRAIVTEYARLRAEGGSHPEMMKFDADGHVEHNADIAEGSAGDRDFLEARRKAHPDKYDPVEKYVNVVHNIVADGDLVAIKSHLFASAKDAGRVFVDMWRIKDGKFVEHWDIIEPISPEAAKSGGFSCGKGTTYAAAKTLHDSALAPVCGKPDESADRVANRKLVLDYMGLAQQPGKAAEAVNGYLAQDFIQHSADIPAGRKGLLDYLLAQDKARQADHRREDIQHVIADGDLVLVHGRVTSDSNPRGTVYLDFFRVKNGKISEHWDIVQPIPPYSTAGRSMTGGPDTPIEPGRHKGGADKM